MLSYNVRSLRDDTAALVRVVRACAPDVLCVQEAPRFAGWLGRAARLARATGLLYVAGGAPSCGTLILAAPRAVPERAEAVAWPRAPGLHRRGLAVAVFRFLAGGEPRRLAVASCHLSLDAAERRAQGGLLLNRAAELAEEAGHAVVAGDLNERPGGRTFRLLSGRLTDARRAAPEGGEHTFPAPAPDRRIDAVLCTPGVEVLGCGVPAVPGAADLRRATDHLPVLARLRLPPRP
ncbi:endonuclease/exonuclease/phosphatase family protein [Streptomyces sp. DSM 44917]|uniref:Endonuclease/exonuclease/phosphatase family protein n=1 Tax=Streptomyces boetiae TaxID=3075541 RepID=A0ABU2LE23_9ACTN|nr:endonuclease/exonuclease/phosphatase family protein [Streptomyces sp. DSM 44917]MDT0309819.1 endonuclease/exonuclease/phosphatase family protein [Streptomyces sp. DSM 44917]